MIKKFLLTCSALLILINIFCVVSLADTTQANLCDQDGETYINASFGEDIPSGTDAYFALYSPDNTLLEIYHIPDASGTKSQKLSLFEKGKNMKVRIFVWRDGQTPVFKSKRVTYANALINGSVVLEAEDIVLNKSYIANDIGNASGDKVVKFTSHRWYPEDITQDDMYADIYVNEDKTDIMCNIWMRCYTNSIETASVYQDLNTGAYFSKFFSSKTDKVYRWTKSTIYLNSGMNHIAFRYRCPSVFDKFIITSNLNYEPDGFGTLPPDLTEENYENEWENLWAKPDIKPIDGHPRLYVTPDTVDDLIRRLTSGNNYWMYDKFKAYSKETLNCTLDTTISNNHNSLLLVKIMSRALCFVTGAETDPSHARQTIDYMKEYLRTVRTPDDTGDITRTRGDIMVAAAIVYDWCYSELTDLDKDYFINEFKKLASSKEIGWPPVNLSSVASHGGEQEIFRDLLSAGIAIYDEYPLMYDLAAGRLFEEYIPARMWLRNTGRFDIGNDYAECRFYSEVWADAIFQSMGYDSIYGDIGGKNLKWLIYSRLPYGSMMPSGDMYTLTRTNPDFYDPNYVLSFAIASNLYNDPVLKQEFNRRFNMGYYGEDIQFFYAIFNEPELDGEIWDNLPLSNITSYPLSGALARTSWQEGYASNTAIGFMNMHEAFVGDHQNIYTGDFQLYYKGLLAMNTGTYNASTQHNEGYKRRAIAANVMLCYDEDESFSPSWSNVTVPNDGGQRLPYLNYDGSSKAPYVMKYTDYELSSDGIAQNDDLMVSKDVKTYLGPNKNTPAFTYVGGDLTNAYSDKVTDYKRHMVFIDLFDDEIPAAFVVYDKMTSKKASLKKTWLLHSQEEPQIGENSLTITRTEGNFNGKLVNKVLLPENPTINYIGGNNNEMFTIGGVAMPPKANTIEGGKYRIEVSPSSQNTQDVFLNAMYMTSADSENQLEMTKFEDDNFIGVALADRLVLFAKGDNISSGFTLNLNSLKGDTLVFISGLADGFWKTGDKYAKTENSCTVFKLSNLSHIIEKTNSAGIQEEFSEETKEKIGDFFIWHTQKGADRGYGNYLYLPSPSLIIDSARYVPCMVFKQLGVSVKTDGNSAIFTIGENSKIIQGIIRNNTVYINPKELEVFLDYKLSYNAYNRVLTFEKQ